MSARHDAWIAAMLRDRFGGDARRTLGQCQTLAVEMVEAFTDLRIVRGHVYCPEPWGKRGHWWLIDSDGAIVDPTAGQFTSGVFQYEEYKEGDDIRLGKCMDCGTAIWGPPGPRPTFCSERCEQSTAAYMRQGHDE